MWGVASQSLMNPIKPFLDQNGFFSAEPFPVAFRGFGGFPKWAVVKNKYANWNAGK